MPAMTDRFDRRQFLLCIAAATGALALGGCAVVPRSGAGDARQLYDHIFQAMLRDSPELATGLGLDTGANADLRSKLSPSGPAGKMGSYKPMVEQLPALRRLEGGEAASGRLGRTLLLRSARALAEQLIAENNAGAAEHSWADDRASEVVR
jgi:uncharacterized protein (DUF885 family)